MKFKFILLLFILLSINVFGQRRSSWVYNFGAGSADRAYAVAQDGAGNTYITGYFQGSADFDGTGNSPTTLTNAGMTDIFVAKYNEHGYLQWAFGIGSSNGTAAPDPATEAGLAIATDKSNNVIVTGTFEGTNVDFDPGAGTNTLSSEGGQDAFVAKYNSNGEYQWAFNIGGTGKELANGVAIDAVSEDIYVVGNFASSNVDFDPDGAASTTHSTTGNDDFFIAKYDKDMDYQWSNAFGNASGDDQCNAITIDNSSNIYVTGLFTAAIDFDPGVGDGTLTPSALTGAMFVAKYASDGTYSDAFQIGGSAIGNFAGGTAITTDNTDIFITGAFGNQAGGTNTADFDPDGGTNNLSSTGISDIFVASYSTALAHNWAFDVGKSLTNTGLGIAVDGTNVYVTGQFYDTNVDFDPDGGSTDNLSSAGVQDIFFWKLTKATGAHAEAFSIGGTGDDGGYGLVVDGSGHIFLAGYFNGTNIDFDPDTKTYSKTSHGSDDIFLGEYFASSTALPVELTSFNVENTKSGHWLTWETATELNNSHFEIQWSDNGRDFEKIGEVQGHGTTAIAQSYDFINDNFGTKTNYYRLKQVDFDGKFAYSKVVSISSDEAQEDFVVFPNPATEQINIRTTGQGSLQLIDVTGRILKEENINGSWSFDISDVPAGLYYVKMNNTVQKVLIQK